jgi:PPK2 family polyphosphate:nucleotide phosphotransferase
MLTRKQLQQFRAPTKGFRLRDYPTLWRGPKQWNALHDDVLKERAKEILDGNIDALFAEQDKLYAEDRYAVLLVIQAMDAAGKDGLVKHVARGLNPTGIQAFSFKQPSPEELDHTFLWRCMKALPEQGRIGIFNRSYYEEVLVVRVHPQLLELQKLPGQKRARKLWRDRYDDINAFERHLVRNGTVVLKVFLNVSRKEQRRRLLARLDDPEKNWKFSAADFEERKLWGRYMDAYEEAIRATSTPWAPWWVIPADHKWVARAVVSNLLTNTLRGLKLRYPKMTPEQQAGLARARRQLAKR